MQKHQDKKTEDEENEGCERKQELTLPVGANYRKAGSVVVRGQTGNRRRDGQNNIALTVHAFNKRR